MANSEDLNRQVRKSISVRFSGDAKLPDPVATAVELGLESAEPSATGEESDLQDVELGFLKPERKYEATICPVAEGTQLENVRVSAGLSVEIVKTGSGEGPVVACAFFTPREGDVTHFFSANFVNESGVTKHRAFSIVGKVMTSDKGTPAEKTFVRCVSKNSSQIPSVSSTNSGSMSQGQ